MILPFLAGVLSFRRAPATWGLIFLNLFVFLFLGVNSPISQKQIEDLAHDENFSQIQGKIFANFIMQKASRYPSRYIAMAEHALKDNDTDKTHLLGMLAMRDTYFFSEAPHLNLSEDPVEMKWWAAKARQFQQTRDANPSYSLGVTEKDSSPATWLTYQFTHNDWSHFLSNMLVLLIFGAALEITIGPVALLAVSLVAGVISALSFLLIDNVSAVPLIGASGAVSGVIALFCMLYWRTGVRHFYFLFIPKRGYLGYVYLPAWVIFVLWFIADLAGYIGTPREMGGVAYSAHLGGEMCGVLVGLIYMVLRRLSGRKVTLIEDGPMTGVVLARSK